MMSNISWEDPPYNNRTEYAQLCENSKPSDFYFSVKEGLEVVGGDTMVAIVPKVYFQKEGCMWDQSMFLEHILPDDLGECMTSCWATDRGAEEVRQDLLTRGFEENKKF